MYPHPKKTNNQQHGFALVIALSLMAFVLVLLLTLSSLVRVETSLARNSIDRLEAKQNARLGALVALGELQRSMGPDTRVSAPVVDQTAPEEQQSRLSWITTAFDASAYSYDASDNLIFNEDFAQPLRHLISSEDPENFDPVDPAAIEPYVPFNADGSLSQNYALLVGPKTLGLEDANSDGVPDDPSQLQDSNLDGIDDRLVAAPQVNIGDDNEGAFAWWVADEGQKAQINITDPFGASPTTEERRARSTTAQRVGTEAIFADFDPQDTDQADWLARVNSVPQMQIVSQSQSLGAGANENFHTITTNSQGLMTDTRRGGLMRDLTAVFKEAEGNGGNVSGPEWDSLLAYQERRIERWRAETEAIESEVGKPHHEFTLTDKSDNAILDALPDRHWNALSAITLREDQAYNDDGSLATELADRIFPPMSDMHIQFDQGGAAWEQLITWGTMRERLGTDSEDTVIARARNTDQVQLTPVIAKATLSTYATMDRSGADIDVALHKIPLVTLWNPYSVPIRMDPANPWRIEFSYSFARADYYVRLEASHPRWQPPFNTWNGDTHIVDNKLWTPRLYLFWNNGTPKNHDPIVTGLLRDSSGNLELTIPPGEAVIFSMREHLDITPSSRGMRLNTEAELWAGLPDTGEQFSLYTVEDVDRQLHDPPSERTNKARFYEVDMFLPQNNFQPWKNQEGRCRHGNGYNYWHAHRRGHGNSYPHPFPLDIDPTDPNYSTLLKVPDPEDLDIAINTNGFAGWTIHRMGLELGRQDYDNGNDNLSGLKIELNTGADTKPLAKIVRPFNNIVRDLSTAKAYDENIAGQQVYLVPWEPEPIPGKTQGFSNASNGLPAWVLSYGLRLPENAFRTEFVNAQENAEKGMNVLDTGSSFFAKTRWLQDFNPTAPLQVKDPASRLSLGFKNPPTYIGGFAMAASLFSNLDWTTTNEYNQFIAGTEYIPIDSIPGETPRAIIYEIPQDIEDLASIASFVNAPLIPTAHAKMPNPGELPGAPISGSDRGDLPHAMAKSDVSYGSLQPTYAIGNSSASIMVARDKAVQSFYGTLENPEPDLDVPYCETKNPSSISHDKSGWRISEVGPSYFPGYDVSWVYNEVLWDSFFLTPESNSRINWGDGLTSADRSFDESAANLQLSGSFNINSVSVKSWAALLYSMLGVEVAGNGSSPDSAPFTRFLDPEADALDESDTVPYLTNEAYAGFRTLERNNIWDDNGTPMDTSDDSGLAHEIVRQVRERGPFLSMSDFVNRALIRAVDDIDGHGLSGALQKAIEDSNLNQAMGDDSGIGTDPYDIAWLNPDTDLLAPEYAYQPTGGLLPERNAFEHLSPKNAEGRLAETAPGDLTQSDLLARMGAVLRPRSDTFTIRAKGISGNQDNPDAMAWCEMTVRRLPDYIDQANPPEALPADLNQNNRNFGRRFEIVSFRWLDDQQI